MGWKIICISHVRQFARLNTGKCIEKLKVQLNALKGAAYTGSSSAII